MYSETSMHRTSIKQHVLFNKLLYNNKITKNINVKFIQLYLTVFYNKNKLFTS